MDNIERAIIIACLTRARDTAVRNARECKVAEEAGHTMPPTGDLTWHESRLFHSGEIHSLELALSLLK